MADPGWSNHLRMLQLPDLRHSVRSTAGSDPTIYSAILCVCESFWSDDYCSYA